MRTALYHRALSNLRRNSYNDYDFVSNNLDKIKNLINLVHIRVVINNIHLNLYKKIDSNLNVTNINFFVHVITNEIV